MLNISFHWCIVFKLETASKHNCEKEYSVRKLLQIHSRENNIGMYLVISKIRDIQNQKSIFDPPKKHSLELKMSLKCTPAICKTL